MRRASIVVLALGILLGTTVFDGKTEAGSYSSASEDSRLAGDGAFRDGLYVGQYMAKNGRPMLAPVGRWSATQDRDAFLSGYRRGYRDGKR